MAMRSRPAVRVMSPLWAGAGSPDQRDPEYLGCWTRRPNCGARSGEGRQSGRPPGAKGPPAHPPELTYPCCLPALGEFSEMTPHEGSRTSLAQPATGLQLPPDARPGPRHDAGFRNDPDVGYPRTCCHQEDSPSGLWRRLGKAVGLTPSGVRIPHPPQNEQDPRTTLHGSGVLLVVPPSQGIREGAQRPAPPSSALAPPKSQANPQPASRLRACRTSSVARIFSM